MKKILPVLSLFIFAISTQAQTFFGLDLDLNKVYSWQRFQMLNYNHNPASILQFGTFVSVSGNMQFTTANVKLDDNTYTYPYASSQAAYIPIAGSSTKHKAFLQTTIAYNGPLEEHSIRASYNYKLPVKSVMAYVGASVNYTLSKFDYSQSTFADQIDPISGFVKDTKEPTPKSTAKQLTSGLGFFVTTGKKEWYVSGFVDNIISNKQTTFYLKDYVNNKTTDIYLQMGYYLKLIDKAVLLPNINYTSVNNIGDLKLGADIVALKKYFVGGSSNFDNTLRMNVGYMPYTKLRVLANYTVFKRGEEYQYDKGTLGVLVGYKF